MFKAIVAHSDGLDAEEAVRDIIQECRKQLGNLNPSAGILFSAIEFEHTYILKELNVAFPGLALIGCTTNGELSSLRGFTEDSLTLTLFCSDQVTFSTGLGRSLSDSPAASVEKAVAEARAKCSEEPRLCLVTPEGLSTSPSKVVLELKKVMGDNFPILGGVAADQYDFGKTFQFHGSEVLTDSVPLMLISGPILFSHGVASGWQPVGRKSTVTSVEHNVINQIDHKPAYDFYRHYFGEHAIPSNEYPLAVFENGSEGNFYLRAPHIYDQESGTVSYSGDVPEQAVVSLTEANRDQIIDAAQDSIRQSLEAYPGKEPEAVLVFSCAARKQILGTRTSAEYEAIKNMLPPSTKICGLYSYGEIGPMEQGETTRMHNETCVTLIMGCE